VASGTVRQSAVARARTVTRSLGFDIVPYPRSHHLDGLVSLLRRLQVDLVLDVGANQGQYGGDLRHLGYKGRIKSFEPVAGAFVKLAKAASGDPDWDVTCCALGEESGSATIHVAANGAASSSFLPMLARHSKAAPDADFLRDEIVGIERLDDVVGAIPGESRVFIKVDTQGFERSVLAGATGLLRGPVVGVQLELSLVSLYGGGPLYDELLRDMSDIGFRLAWLYPGFQDPTTGELLQFDGAFVRSALAI
jgi:FkbM family methyltransferase